MSEEKKKEPKSNKAMTPDSNKAEMVKIKFKAQRTAEGVEVDADGCASVSADLAQYLVSIGYADYEE